MTQLLPETVFADKLVCYALPPDAGVTSRILDYGCKGLLLLEADGPKTPEKSGNVVRARYGQSSSVRNNNCDVVILGGSSAFALRARKFLGEFETICVPLSITSAAGLFGLLRYMLRKHLVFQGTTRLDPERPSRLLVFRNRLATKRGRPRLFGPTGRAPLAILKDLTHVNYVLLRWASDIENGEPVQDLDILVDHQSLPELYRYIKQEVGTFPIDTFADNGQDGHAYKSIPYYPQAFARRLLTSTTARASGIKVLSQEANYTAFVYHLLFHKCILITDHSETLTPHTWGKEKYYNELLRLAEEAGQSSPGTIGDLEAHLKQNSAFPMRDTISFLSNGNEFLKQRYLSDEHHTDATITVFIARNFDLSEQEIAEIGERLEQKGFAILASISLTEQQRSNVIQYVRGGNWYDKKALEGFAEPRHLFLCFDEKPQRPGRKSRRRYPLIDNERVLVKREIRKWFGTVRGDDALNVIHASDNTHEALEYLGLIDEELLKFLPHEFSQSVLFRGEV